MNDDSLNSDLADALACFARGYQEQVGYLPTADKFAEILALIIQTTNDDLFNDANNKQLKEVTFTFVKKSRSRKLAAGDIYYFPSKTVPGKCVFVAFVGMHKPYGNLFVSFRGFHDAKINVSELVPVPYPLVSSDKLIQLGVWQFATNNVDLLSRYGIVSEVYLNKAFYPKREDIGVFGVAERLNSDGSINNRQLTKEEAQQIGIFQNRNDVRCQPEVIEEFLQSRGWL
jgi:hypothetical protein